MPRGEYMKARLWRWRGNPLRRRDDIAEAGSCSPSGRSSSWAAPSPGW